MEKYLSLFLHQCTFTMHRPMYITSVNGEDSMERKMIRATGQLIALQAFDT